MVTCCARIAKIIKTKERQKDRKKIRKKKQIHGNSITNIIEITNKASNEPKKNAII